MSGWCRFGVWGEMRDAPNGDHRVGNIAVAGLEPARAKGY